MGDNLTLRDLPVLKLCDWRSHKTHWVSTQCEAPYRAVGTHTKAEVCGPH